MDVLKVDFVWWGIWLQYVECYCVIFLMCVCVCVCVCGSFAFYKSHSFQSVQKTSQELFLQITRVFIKVSHTERSRK